MSDHAHEYGFVEFVFASWWACESCDYRPTEQEWNAWRKEGSK